MKIRLNKYMAQLGIGSRRECDRLIETGRVKVNSCSHIDLGTKIDPDCDKIEYNGKVLCGFGIHKYIIFHKPKGYVVSTKGQHSKTVYDLLPIKIPYVGRLDKDTTGLLVFSTDGELACRLTHPSYGVEKSYIVSLEKKPRQTYIQKLRKGVILEDGLTSSAKVRPLKQVNGPYRMELVIHEGKKRQIKRMCAALGLNVVALHRHRFGPVNLDALGRSQWRSLTDNEIRLLKKSVGL